METQPNQIAVGTQAADGLVPAEVPLPENKIFYPALDGLRAIAVLLVFMVHYGHKFDVLAWGWVGVDIFFVLSGFLITGILYDTRERSHRVRNFYVRRTLRIFPLYYGVLLVALLLTPIFRWDWNAGWLLWPLYLGNYARYWFGDYQGWVIAHESLVSLWPPAHRFALQMTHFWSLCLEEQFYLVWPPIVFLVRDRIRLRNLCIWVVVVTPLLRLVCVLTLSPALLAADFLYRLPPLRFDALLLGGLLALCLRGPEAGQVQRAAKPAVFGLLIVFAIVLGGITVVTHRAPSHLVTTPWMSTIGFTLIDLLAAGVMLLCLQRGSVLYRVLTIGWLRRLGQMSYGFYIFHFLLQGMYVALAQSLFGVSGRLMGPATIVFGMVGSLLISYVSFHYFEAPFLRLKDRFTV